VQIGAELKRGDGSFNGQKQLSRLINSPADTPTVTRAVEGNGRGEGGLATDIKVSVTFRQEDYIDASIENVREALVEGSIIVALVLIPFFDELA